MQQATVMEDATTLLAMAPNASNNGDTTETHECTYDNLFPALKQVAPVNNNTSPQNHWNSNKMRVGSTNVTQSVFVPAEERKQSDNDKFGERESTRTCMQIMKETDTNIEMCVSKDGSITFLVTGRPTNVQEAKRKVRALCQTQSSKQIAIPIEHHGMILGKGGQRLRDLEKNTSTKIHIPNVSDKSELITITGTRENTEKAMQEIQYLSDLQSRKGLEKFEIPKIYHPFIVGAQNERLNELSALTGTKIAVPPPSVNKTDIIISGDKEGVSAAKAKIEEIYNKMLKCCKTISAEIPKAQHKYIIGSRGSTLAEILRETNVSVEMPPTDSNADVILLRGPQENLARALSLVYEKANSIKTVRIQCEMWIHKYIIGRQGVNVKKMMQDYPRVHIEFADNEDVIELEGPPEDIDPLQKELQQTVDFFTNTYTHATLMVDSKHCKHIIGKSGTNVNRLKEEANVTININEQGNSVTTIRIEGPRAGVEQAHNELSSMITKLENEDTRELKIDHRLFKKLIGPKGQNIREIRDQFNQVNITFPTTNDARQDVVTLRGPKIDVDKCAKYLSEIVLSMKDNLYTAEVPIFKQFHRFIIGKAGANIRKIRDETQTEIDLPAEGDVSDVIVITGKKNNVEEAKERIIKIQNELANIVQVEINIPQKFYNSLIGTGGKLINAIMEECGGVTIKFPPGDSKDDKVIIRGPKDDVEKAKSQLLELSNECQLSSFTAEVKAHPDHHRYLIGQSGANIKKIRESTSARIIFPTNRDANRETITIIGKKEAVEQAKSQLEKMITEISNITTEKINVPARYHKHFVAHRGEVLEQISYECGGVKISFPRMDAADDLVVIKGSKDFIELAKQRIQEKIADLDSQVTIVCAIPQKHHRALMGRKGVKVQNVTSTHNVQIKFPEKSMDNNYANEDGQTDGAEATNGIVAEEYNEETAPACDKILISGRPENCEAAKQAFMDLVPITIEVEVPYEFHPLIIGRRGTDIRQLMSTYDVNIALSPAELKCDIIEISGTKANVEEAKQAILERCEKLKQERLDRELRNFSLTMDVPLELHSKIIGRRGAVITKLRSDFNVQINFPRKEDNQDDSTVTILGYEKDALEAKEAIMKIVNEYNDKIKEEIEIDSRIHARLIGQRSRNIRKVMDDFKVEIEFPRRGDPNKDIVTISGSNEDDVQDAKDYLLNLAEEYMQDVVDREQYMKKRSGPTDPRRDVSSNNNGFVVMGAPWQQSTPDTESIRDFPSISSHRAHNGPSNNDVVDSSDNSAASSSPILLQNAWRRR